MLPNAIWGVLEVLFQALSLLKDQFVYESLKTANLVPYLLSLPQVSGYSGTPISGRALVKIQCGFLSGTALLGH